MSCTVDTNSEETRNVDNAATLTDFHRQGIGPHIGVGTSIERPVPEVGNQLIEALGKFRDLRFR
jgi:hypothetical protein